MKKRRKDTLGDLLRIKEAAKSLHSHSLWQVSTCAEAHTAFVEKVAELGYSGEFEAGGPMQGYPDYLLEVHEYLEAAATAHRKLVADLRERIERHIGQHRSN